MNIQCFTCDVVGLVRGVGGVEERVGTHGDSELAGPPLAGHELDLPLVHQLLEALPLAQLEAWQTAVRHTLTLGHRLKSFTITFFKLIKRKKKKDR